MTRVKTFLPPCSVVTTPDVHLFDEAANVIIMDDCGEGILSLKTLLLRDETIPVSIAQSVGSALGTFLAQLHVWGRTEEVMALFDGNVQARTMSAWVTYGRLASTLAGKDQLPALQDPPLDVSETQLAAISKIADSAADAMHMASETTIHGDFWPGNMLVKLGGEGGEMLVERIFVLDWELAKPGLPGFDIGQFCAELHQARRFYLHCAASASAVMDAFLKAYRVNQDKCTLHQTARVAQTHLGAHVVAWTPRNRTWQDKQSVREVVMEGVGYLLSAGEEEHSLSQSIFGSLLGHERIKP